MKTRFYFLGANTADGFRSCYGTFCPDGFLSVIKGGPGTGKSGFLRKIGSEAEKRGYTVEYVLCSGDPDSLDGVYLPEKKLGYTDGTAPHVQEPRVCGADGQYLNFGAFLDAKAMQNVREALLSASGAYKREYTLAYACMPRVKGSDLPLPDIVPRRFRIAVTCRGLVTLEPPAPMQTVSEKRLAKLLPGAEEIFLHPLNADQPVGVLKEGSYYEVPFSLPDCSAAVEHLRRAKALHDELEELIRPYVDFSRVSALAAEHISLFL